MPVPSGAATVPRASEPVCQEAVDLVKHFEGLYLRAYLCPAGVPTIGYGHTAGVKLGQAITEAQADAMLVLDLDEAGADVDRLVRIKLEAGERGALRSFVFNLGAGSLASSTLLRKLNDGDRVGAAAEFGKWVMATVDGVKKPLSGLVKRRAAEAAMFRGEDWRDALDGATQHAMPQMGAAPEGEEDDRIQRIQRVVGVKADGVYGPATKTAVAAWQRAHGLVSDGIVGPKTASAMGIE